MAGWGLSRTLKLAVKFVTVTSQLEAEASICSIKIEQTARHITVHNECHGEGEWLKYLSDSHCLVVGDFNQHSELESLSWARELLAPTSFC